MGNSERGAWGSRFGFILAAAGSAIGLGNIWRFPYVTGNNGGAAFVLIYIVFVILIGLPVMIAEMSLGRHTKRNPAGAFAALAPHSLWPWVGMLGIFTGLGILSYYSVIAGWTVGYFLKTISGGFPADMNYETSSRIFSSFVANPAMAIGLLFVFIAMTAGVVMGGVAGGIEKWSKILMPILLLLMILLTLRSVTLENAGAGLHYYLKPDFSKVTTNTIGNALGQALFSLSLGMGAMITYGSYVSKRVNLVTSAGWVCLFDTIIAIVAGLMIFPALFSQHIPPSGGPGLVFQTLPLLFKQMPGGSIFGAGFFLLLSVAALTSTISLLEVVVAFLVDEKKWQRPRAVWTIALAAFLLGIPSALSQSASPFFTRLPLLHTGFLDLANILAGNFSLILGAFLISLFVGFRWGANKVEKEITIEGQTFYFKRWWKILIRYLCPIAIFVIFLYILLTRNYF
ncbi:MAG TPA: sodium-dependent transporter [bacterium]|nr:sodium-dependent transporter [bacterium]HPG44180.1 sodium-dependent transporter [bacterium]HPM96547.1 sodium-dependent transporter [bacterium]